MKDNWFSSASSNNYGTPGLINDYQQQESSLTLPYDVVTPNNDGYQDILTLNLNFDEPGWTGYIDIFNQQGITIHTLVENQLFSSKPIHWNITKTNGELLERGIYALIYKGVHIESGKTRTEKMTFYVNR
jgi:hypothetical protein